MLERYRQRQLALMVVDTHVRVRRGLGFLLAELRRDVYVGRKRKI
jgi:hypothetical protein